MTTAASNVSGSALKVAFLGMGLMGSRMSLRLLQAGFAVSVWNRSAAAAQPLLDAGAQPILHWAQLAKADVIALCLANDDAMREVFAQIAPYLQTSHRLVDFSSTSHALTLQLAEQSALQGATWLDVPVSGGVIGAEQGSLVMFAGGCAEKIQQLAPFFAPLAQRVTYMGAVGSGQVTKICNQLIVAANSALIAEAVALAQRAGVDATQLAPALAGGFADSKPLQILAPRMSQQQFEPLQWKVRTLQKDLANAQQLAERFGLHIAVAERAAGRLQQHAEHGHAEHDLSSLILLMDAKINA